MLAAERCSEPFADTALSKNDLLEVNRSKISLHHAKAGYSYPTIRLPHKFSKLAGLSTHIYQTVHEGALAFLVVISTGAIPKNNAERPENAEIDDKSCVFTRRRSPARIRPSPSFFLQSDTLEPSIEDFSLAKMLEVLLR